MLKQVENILTDHSVKSALVAYSGGIDSHVLLHLLSQCTNINIRAIHVNHGINSNANKWQQHCQKICTALNVELITKRINPEQNANEAELRKLRYAVIDTVRHETEFLLTGHNKSDQAETVLLQLLRGAGIKGLAAMPLCSANKVLRPLLDFARDEITAYAMQNTLHWIEDESNAENRYNRNFLRNNIIPELQQRWPSMVNTLSRSAEHCADADKLLAEYIADDFQQIVSTKNTLLIDKLLKFSKTRQAYIIRFWLKKLNLPIPSQAKINNIQADVLTARQDANPLVYWRGAEIRRYKNELFAMQPLAKHDAKLTVQWDPTTNIVLPNELGAVSALPAFENQHCEIRFRQGGERLQVDGRVGTHDLKKLMQESGIPPWLRDRKPLLYVNKNLICILS